MKKVVKAMAASSFLLLFSMSISSYAPTVELESECSSISGRGCRVYNDEGQLVAACGKCNCARLYKAVRTS